MKLYIDSRAVGEETYNTLIEVYVNGKVAQKGILQMAEFSCINLGDISIKELELKFFVVDKSEGNKYNKISKCPLKKVPDILELDLLEAFVDYDAETNLTIESNVAPKTWTYAYSTKITEIDPQPEYMVFVFNEDCMDGVSICEIQQREYNVTYERVIDKEEISRSFKEWKSKWIKYSIITFAVSIILSFLAVLLIASFNWSPSSGKAQMSLFVLATLLILVVPNGVRIMYFKNNLKTKEVLNSTEIIDSVALEKLKEKYAGKSKCDEEEN